MGSLGRWIWNADKRSGQPITDPYVAILFAIGSAIMSLILVLLDVKESLWWGSLLAVLFFAIFVHFLWIWNKTINLTVIAKTAFIAIVGCLYFWLVGKQVVRKYREENAAGTSLSQEYEAIEKLTLRDYFREDFGDTMKISRWQSGRIADIHFLVEGQLYENDRERSTFVGYYVPSSPNTYKICELLTTQYAGALGWGRTISSKTTDDTQEISTNDLIFTKRIFIYHQDHLEPSQIAALVKAYGDYGLSVMFRGSEYVSDQMNARLARAKQDAQQPKQY